MCLSIVLTADLGNSAATSPETNPVLSQGSFGINFITPAEGEHLSGNITIKVNATVISNIPFLLRWNNDSWIDITDMYNATSKFYEYTMDVTCLPTGNVTFEAKQDTGHGIIHASVEATIDWYHPPILVVCDFYDVNITDYYTDALEALGYHEGIGYSTWHTVTNGSPTADDLLQYQFVIWFRGADTSAISLAERNAIQTYLHDMSLHKMLLSGTEIAWRAYNGGGYEAWLSTNFGVNDYIGDGSNSENVLGRIETPFSGTNYTYGGGDGSQMGGWADWLRTLDLSLGLFEYASSGYDEYAATMSPSVGGILFGFAFDAISTAAYRIDLMNRILNYLEIYSPPKLEIVAPSEGGLHRSPLPLSWNSSSEILTLVYTPTYKIFVDGKLVIDDWLLESYQLPITDGTHTVRIVCEDNYGQRDYGSITIEVDATYPITDPLNFNEGAVLKSGSLLIFNITDFHLDNVVSGWDFDAWTAFPSPYQTYLPSGDGIHVFHVNATDTAGNWNYTQFLLTCDDSPPSISLIGLMNSSSMNGGSNIQLEVNDTYLNSVLYHWDLDEDSVFVTEYETSLPLDEGVHDLFLNATDLAGNQRLSHYQFFTDDTAPTIHLLNISNYAILQTGAQMNFFISDLHFDSVGWRWDSTDITHYDVPSFALYAPAVEGIHYLFINATDEAGNSHNESYEFVIDNAQPEIVLSSPAQGVPIVGGTSITVEVTDIHLSSVQYRWDLEDWGSWDVPYVTTAPMDDGFHSLFIEATDEAGNWIQVVFVFVIDNTGGNGTTTPSTTPGIPIDFAAGLGILALGVGLGVGVSFLILQVLTRRKPKA